MDWLKRTYGNLCHIGGKWVSDQSTPRFHYFFSREKGNSISTAVVKFDQSI